MVKKSRPIVLIIRDGWGERQDTEFNAIKQANTPIADSLSKNWPRTLLVPYGEDVGLPKGVMGNSEVGHQNIGAGRIVEQEIVRISKALKTGDFLDNEVLNSAIEAIKRGGKKLHLMGLFSDAGVHSDIQHLFGLMELAKSFGLDNLNIHIFTDGRDSPPKSGIEYLKQLDQKISELDLGQIATVSGRYYAMDRDNRWERTKLAYDALTGKSSQVAKSARDVIEGYYKNPVADTMVGDEFITPTMIVDEKNFPVGPIEDGDVVIFYNFRGDRPRQLVKMFTQDGFDEIDREERTVKFVTMTEYEQGLCKNILFPKPEKMKGTLGEVVSLAGVKQFRCAETEKYPHVTFFFNDYREEPFKGEDREMIASPRDIPTYDLKPEMSAKGVYEATNKAILSGEYALVVVNFANPDMVGHTGNFEATKNAVEVVDECVGQLLKAVDEVNGAAIITADHGNAEIMWDKEVNMPHTQHTTNTVELIIYGEGLESLKLKTQGKLADIAPTILAIAGLVIPPEMTGSVLAV